MSVHEYKEYIKGMWGPSNYKVVMKVHTDKEAHYVQNVCE